MFAYCLNNPANNADPNGKHPDSLGGYVGELLADLFWDLLDEDAENTLYEVGDAIYNNFEFSFGLGLGMFVGVEIEEFISVEAGLYYDVFHVEYSDGEWETCEYAYEGIYAEVPFVPIIDESTEQYRSAKSDGWVTKSSHPTLRLGTGVYLFGGGSFSVGFDIIQLCEDICKIFWG